MNKTNIKGEKMKEETPLENKGFVDPKKVKWNDDVVTPTNKWEKDFGELLKENDVVPHAEFFDFIGDLLISQLEEVIDYIAQDRGWEESGDIYRKHFGLPIKFKSKK